MPYVAEKKTIFNKESFAKKASKMVKALFDFRVFSRLFKRLKMRLNTKKRERLKTIFDEFNNKNLPLYRKERISIEEMVSLAGDYCAFISGSDQVWSTKLQGDCCDKGMFLKFVPENVKRIAYAPSMGARCTQEGIEDDICHSVGYYNAVSLREREGAKYLEKIMGEKFPVVLDPTLLISPREYDAIVQEPKDVPDKYILVYRFGDVPHTLMTIASIAKELKLPIIELPSSDVSLMDNLKKRYDIGPDKFIWLIRHATLVCTDSYHATIFSIINHTPFLTFFREEPTAATTNLNARVLELLEMTGLSERLIYPGQTPDASEVLNVDFSEAENSIINRRASSLAFLKNALNSDEEQ